MLVGDVFRVNDDRIDNYFLEKAGRFPEIEEDEPALHLLTKDYAVITGSYQLCQFWVACGSKNYR